MTAAISNCQIWNEQGLSIMKLKKFFVGRKSIPSALALSLLGMSSLSAHAAWGTAVTNITTLTQGLVTAVVALCALAGVGAFAFAGKQLLKKSGDRGDDVEWAKIGYAVLAGVFLVAVAYVALQSVETMGGSAGDVGKTITLPG